MDKLEREGKKNCFIREKSRESPTFEDLVYAKFVKRSNRKE